MPTKICENDSTGTLEFSVAATVDTTILHIVFTKRYEDDEGVQYNVLHNAKGDAEGASWFTREIEGIEEDDFIWTRPTVAVVPTKDDPGAEYVSAFFMEYDPDAEQWYLREAWSGDYGDNYELFEDPILEFDGLTATPVPSATAIDSLVFVVVNPMNLAATLPLVTFNYYYGHVDYWWEDDPLGLTSKVGAQYYNSIRPHAFRTKSAVTYYLLLQAATINYPAENPDYSTTTFTLLTYYTPNQAWLLAIGNEKVFNYDAGMATICAHVRYPRSQKIYPHLDVSLLGESQTHDLEYSWLQGWMFYVEPRGT